MARALTTTCLVALLMLPARLHAQRVPPGSGPLVFTNHLDFDCSLSRHVTFEPLDERTGEAIAAKHAELRSMSLGGGQLAVRHTRRQHGRFRGEGTAGGPVSGEWMLDGGYFGRSVVHLVFDVPVDAVGAYLGGDAGHAVGEGLHVLLEDGSRFSASLTDAGLSAVPNGSGACEAINGFLGVDSNGGPKIVEARFVQSNDASTWDDLMFGEATGGRHRPGPTPLAENPFTDCPIPPPELCSPAGDPCTQPGEPDENVPFTFAPVMRVGDPAPVSGGGTLATLSDHSMDSMANQAFSSAVETPGDRANGVFSAAADGTIRKAGFAGDVIPGPRGGTVDSAGQVPSANAVGDIAYLVILDDGRAAFVLDTGGEEDSYVIGQGDFVPAPIGLEIVSLPQRQQLTSSGDVVFFSNWNVATACGSLEAILVAFDGVVTEVAAVRCAFNPVLDLTYERFGIAGPDRIRPDRNGADQTVFWAQVDHAGASGIEAVILVGAGERIVALEGDTAEGLPFSYQRVGAQLTINEVGQVLFAVSAGGDPANAIILDTDGEHRVVVKGGDVAPGSGGRTFSSFRLVRDAWLWLNDCGDVAFWATLADGTHGIWVHDACADVLRLVALQGQDAPGFPGETFHSLGGSVVDNHGHVGFRAQLSDGTVTLMLATPIPGVGLGARDGDSCGVPSPGP